MLAKHDIQKGPSVSSHTVLTQKAALSYGLSSPLINMPFAFQVVSLQIVGFYWAADKTFL